jgi:hypothetical protein
VTKKGGGTRKVPAAVPVGERQARIALGFARQVGLDFFGRVRVLKTVQVME